MTNLLSARGLVKRFGGLTATDHVDLDLRQGELHAVIGPNGAGKTTLLGQLTGEITPEAGTLHLDGHSILGWSVPRRALAGVARSFQISRTFQGFSVLENVMLIVQARLGHSFRWWVPVARDPALITPALAALRQVGLEGRARDDAANLAHGEQRQLELAMALAMNPRLLLLDEPLAGMSAAESATVVGLLLQLKRHFTILLIEHDMGAVFSLADRVSVLVHGRVLACDVPAAIRSDVAVKSAYLGDA
jgi:branched-chain amino acid transport system ATP-binding protein